MSEATNGAMCACLRVICKNNEQGGVVTREWWECTECQTHFVKRLFLERALNEVDSLREQVRLYELAAERWWLIRPITHDGQIVKWCTAERGSFVDRLLGEGPTPTAAIAAAEKKEQAHG